MITVRARRGQDIGDQFGRDRFAGPVFLLLPGVAEIGQNRRDSIRAGPAHGVNQDQQFDQIGVYGRTGRLNDKRIRPAHAFIILHIRFAVGKPLNPHIAERQAQPLCNRLTQFWVAAPGKQLDFGIVAHTNPLVLPARSPLTSSGQAEKIIPERGEGWQGQFKRKNRRDFGAALVLS